MSLDDDCVLMSLRFLFHAVPRPAAPPWTSTHVLRWIITVCKYLIEHYITIRVLF